MIRKYEFDYGFGEADCSFEVDDSIFTNEFANATLEFFDWFYDKDADPIDEVMKKYAMRAIKEATFNGYNLYGVIGEFDSMEGYSKVDGSYGITLISVSEYEFDESQLEMTKTLPTW
jgi:hypothetical protein